MKTNIEIESKSPTRIELLVYKGGYRDETPHWRVVYDAITPKQNPDGTYIDTWIEEQFPEGEIMPENVWEEVYIAIGEQLDMLRDEQYYEVSDDYLYNGVRRSDFF